MLREKHLGGEELVDTEDLRARWDRVDDKHVADGHQEQPSHVSPAQRLPEASDGEDLVGEDSDRADGGHHGRGCQTVREEAASLTDQVEQPGEPVER